MSAEIGSPNKNKEATVATDAKYVENISESVGDENFKQIIYELTYYVASTPHSTTDAEVVEWSEVLFRNKYNRATTLTEVHPLLKIAKSGTHSMRNRFQSGTKK